MTRRVPDWPARLGAFVAHHFTLPFAWGSQDCGTFSADWGLQLAGEDLLAELRGPRRHERDGIRQARALGGVPAIMARAGLVSIAPALAQRGDWLWLPQGRRRVLAVCTGLLAAAPGRHGLEQGSPMAAVMAWRLE